MRILIKKAHMYLGLLNFTILLVFGIGGLSTAFEPAPAKRRQPDAAVRSVDFSPPPSLTDIELAQAVQNALDVPATAPLQRNSVRRDADHNVTFDLATLNGRHKVTVLEAEKRVRIEERRITIWQYINNLHHSNSSSQISGLAFRMWTWYNELAVWSLSLMSASGIYLWLASRPRLRWAQVSFISGSALFLTLYFMMR
jgi:hypothetical protein